MNKKKILLSSLIFVAPFFAKGVTKSAKNNSLPEISNSIELKCYTSNIPYGIYPLPIDHQDFFHASRRFDIRHDLNVEFGYVVSDNNFSILSFKDHSVKYTRPDKSGFWRKSGSRTWRNQNPGAIRTSPFTKKMGAVGDAGGFAVFPDEETGMIALKALLRSEAYDSLSVYDAVHKYAPFCDNNDPISYQRHLQAKTGIKTNRKMCDLSDDEIDKIANTIKILEGWIPGEHQSFGGVSDILEEIHRQQKQYNS